MSGTCQCLTNAGVKCTRPVAKGANRCWQHKNNCRPVKETAKEKTKEPSVGRELPGDIVRALGTHAPLSSEDIATLGKVTKSSQRAIHAPEYNRAFWEGVARQRLTDDEELIKKLKTSDIQNYIKSLDTAENKVDAIRRLYKLSTLGMKKPIQNLDHDTLSSYIMWMMREYITPLQDERNAYLKAFIPYLSREELFNFIQKTHDPMEETEEEYDIPSDDVFNLAASYLSQEDIDELLRLAIRSYNYGGHLNYIARLLPLASPEASSNAIITYIKSVPIIDPDDALIDYLNEYATPETVNEALELLDSDHYKRILDNDTRLSLISMIGTHEQ